MSDTTTPKGQALTPAIGGLYNWKGQPERLVYMGARRYPGDPRPWHQFAKVETPHMCWSEVLPSDLASFEETKGTTMTTTNTSGAADLPEALRSIQRFEVVDCIDDKHVPAVIPKPHGPWVRYEDHIAALAAGQATAAPAGDWLWVKLMDFCKKRGFAPANFNDLFEIVDDARAPADRKQGEKQ